MGNQFTSNVNISFVSSDLTANTLMLDVTCSDPDQRFRLHESAQITCSCGDESSLVSQIALVGECFVMRKKNIIKHCVVVLHERIAIQATLQLIISSAIVRAYNIFLDVFSLQRMYGGRL